MVSLQDFTSYPETGTVPICEKSGRLCTVPIRELSGENFYLSKNYPQINVNIREMFNTTSARNIDAWKTVLVPVNEPVVKRITRTFFENGFYEALEEARSPEILQKNLLIGSLAEYTFRIMEVFDKIRSMVMPQIPNENIANIAPYSETREWVKSYIRCIEWHPNCFKIAVAASDDVIRIYTNERATVPVLKSFHQKSITCMAWRPFTVSDLAVGCQAGICLWGMFNNIIHVTRVSQVTLLKHRNHAPVTSIAWSPNGCLLASASIGDTDILIWDVDKSTSTPLKRVGPTCSFLKWSPEGSKLFSATIGNVFRVWHTENQWTPERWTTALGSIQSAAWSPCGSFLLFVTSDESILYKLQFVEEQLFTTPVLTKQAVPVANLSKIKVDNREVGGLPQAIAWDPNGLYLAIMFKESPCVAIFSTFISKYDLNISPSSFLTGVGTEYPCAIRFQCKNENNLNSVLTIGWSSGRVEYFPFVNM